MTQLNNHFIIDNFKYITDKIPFIISTEEIVLGKEISKLLNLVKIKYNIDFKHLKYNIDKIIKICEINNLKLNRISGGGNPIKNKKYKNKSLTKSSKSNKSKSNKNKKGGYHKSKKRNYKLNGGGELNTLSRKSINILIKLFTSLITFLYTYLLSASETNIAWQGYNKVSFGVEKVFNAIPMVGHFTADSINLGFYILVLTYFCILYIGLGRVLGTSIGYSEETVDKCFMDSVYWLSWSLKYCYDTLTEIIKLFNIPSPIKFIEAFYGGYKQLNKNERIELQERGLTSYIFDESWEQIRCYIINLLDYDIHIYGAKLNLATTIDPNKLCETQLLNQILGPMYNSTHIKLL
jgi:hypothetical protein